MMKIGDLHHFPDSMFMLGLLIVIAGSVSLIIVQLESHIWNNPPTSWAILESQVYEDNLLVTEPPSIFSLNLKKFGEEQKCNWAQRMHNLKSELQISHIRQEILNRLLTDSASLSFLGVRQAYEEEKQIANEIKDKIRKAEIHTGREGFLGLIILNGLAIIMSVVASNKLREKAKELSMNSQINWRPAFWTFAMILFISWTITFIITSILSTNKPWIGATSYFVSPQTWLLERFSSLGLALIMAVPITLLWHCTKRVNIPSIDQFKLSMPDGNCGVGPYVAFIHSWSIISIVAFAVLVATGIKYERLFQYQFSNAYLIPAYVGLAILLVICYRTVRNALIVRELYWRKVSSVYNDINSVQKASIGLDPTLGFIGDNWWKLPATWTGIIGTTWAAFEWMGISELIAKSIK